MLEIIMTIIVQTTSIIINIILILTLDDFNEQLVLIIFMHEPQTGKSS